MPRDTESIKHPLHTNPAEAISWGGFQRGGIWNIYPNSIGVPAGRRRGRFATMESLKKVQSRYWAKGIPLGMELELELPSSLQPESCYCGLSCDECYNNNHGECEDGSCEAYAGGRYRYYRDYVPVKDVLEIVGKRVQDGMKNYAHRVNNDWFHYTNPITAKGDGSLVNGVEFNLLPFTRSAFTKYAASVWQDIGYDKFEGFHTDTAGLHIHMPKSAFTDPELFMWLLLMENLSQVVENGKSFLDIIAQREPCAYNARNVSSSIDQLRNAVGNRRWFQGRHNQINFNGHGNTIEVRMFKSVQQPERLIKNYAFLDMSWRYVHLLSDFVNDEKYSQALQFLSNTDMFAHYLTNPNAKGYTEELSKFIKRRWKRVSTAYQYDGDALTALRDLNENFQSRNWEVLEEHARQENNTQTNEEVNDG
jgi:hypothetical protein